MKIDNVFGNYADGHSLFTDFYLNTGKSLDPINTLHFNCNPNSDHYDLDTGFTFVKLDMQDNQLVVSPYLGKLPLDVKLVKGSYDPSTLCKLCGMSGHLKAAEPSKYYKHYDLILDQKLLKPLGKIDLILKHDDATTFFKSEAWQIFDQIAIVNVNLNHAVTRFTELEQRFRALCAQVSKLNLIKNDYRWTLPQLKWSYSSKRDIKMLLKYFDVTPRSCARAGY